MLQATRNGKISLAIGSAIGLAAFLLRFIGIMGHSLWYDEIQSVTFSYRPFPFSIVGIQAQDTHPPLYYLFLSLWLMLGTSDFTILLFSVLLSTLTVVLLYRFLKRTRSVLAAAIGASILAVSPLAIFWSQFARMYSFLMLMCFCCFYTNDRYLQDEKRNRWLSLGIVLSGLAVVYSHMMGLLCLFFILLYFWGTTRGAGAVRRRWLRLQFLVGVLALPALDFPLNKGSLGHTLVPSVFDIASTLSLFLGGPSLGGDVWVCIGSILFFATIGMLAFSPEYRSRWFAWSFGIGPFVVVALASYLYKPSWIQERSFAFLVPFYALGLALLWLTPWNRRAMVCLARALVLAAAVLMCFGSVQHLRTYQKPDDIYDSIAQKVRQIYQPGDRIIVESDKLSWGLKWYLLGPGWDGDIARVVMADWSKRCTVTGGIGCLTGLVREFDRRPLKEPYRIEVFSGRPIEDESGRIILLARKNNEGEKLRQMVLIQGRNCTVQVSKNWLSLELCERDTVNYPPIH